jgi:nitric oxide reductase activation protein
MSARRSTRLGAALRHAGVMLEQRAAQRKLLLVVTDGEPSDVDVHDRKYLVQDAKHATERNRRRGICGFCVGLDRDAEPALRTMFGAGNYIVLDQLEALPRKLSQLCGRLSSV